MTRPISETYGYIDISKGSSEDFNKIVHSFTYDIIDVFNASNENETKIKNNQDLLIQENLFLQRKINELEAKMKTVEASISRVRGDSDTYKMYKNFHTSDDVKVGENYTYDNDYGIITMNYEDSHELALSQYPQEFLSKNIEIDLEYRYIDSLDNQVGPTQTDNLKTDPDLINIVSKDISNYWVKNIETEDDIARIDFDVTIKMPVRIIPNLFINSIGIKSHPIYSMSLNSIYYTDINNQNEVLIPQFPNTNSEPNPISQIENLKFMFPTIASSKVKFSFSQPYSVERGSKKTFTIGFKSIDIEAMNPTSELGYFITELKIPGEGKYFSRVLEPKVTPAVEGVDYGDLVSHGLMYSPYPDSPTFSFGSEILSNKDTVYIKTTLRKSGEIIPAIKGLEFSYLPK